MSDKSLNGSNVEKILTRFFFEKKEPCFQIIIQIKSQRKVIGQYNTYPKYKRAMETFKSKIENNQLIEFPNSTISVQLSMASPKVA